MLDCLTDELYLSVVAGGGGLGESLLKSLLLLLELLGYQLYVLSGKGLLRWSLGSWQRLNDRLLLWNVR